MSTAQQLLLAAGVIAAAVGVLLGIPYAAERSKSPEANRHLRAAHLEALMQSPLHLGLAFAVGATGFDSWAASVAAILLVVGSGLAVLGSITSWIGGVDDQFAVRSPGFVMQALSGPLIVVGVVIVTIGVLSGL